VQQKILESLRVNGCHVTGIDEILGDTSSFGLLNTKVDMMMESPAIKRQIQLRRSDEGIKWYVVRVLGYKPMSAVTSEIASVVLNKRLLTIVNAYLGLWCRLIYLDVWWNFPVCEGEPEISSEAWHRDGEDRKILKVFIYLTDVEEFSGPLEYRPGTHNYQTADVKETTRGEGLPMKCVGRKGTAVLFDACGLHRGGRATTSARVVLVATYASDAAIGAVRYRVTGMSNDEIKDEAAYAVRINPRDLH